VFDAGTVAGLSVIDIDLTQVSEVRARLPIAQHKRPFTIPEPA
jgi:hypothetical protein